MCSYAYQTMQLNLGKNPQKIGLQSEICMQGTA